MVDDWLQWRGLLGRLIAESPVERRPLFTSVVESLGTLPADVVNVLVGSLARRLWAYERNRERGDELSIYFSGLDEAVIDRDAKRILREVVPLECTLATVEGRQVWERLKGKSLSGKRIVDSPHYSNLFVGLVRSAVFSHKRATNPYWQHLRGTPKEAATRHKARTQDLERSISMLNELQNLVGSDRPLISPNRVDILNDEMKRLLTINGALDAIKSNTESRLRNHENAKSYDDAISAGMMSRKQNDDRQNYLRILLSRLTREGFPINGHLEGAIYPIARIIGHDYDMEPHHVIQAGKNVRRFFRRDDLTEYGNLSVPGEVRDSAD